MIKPIQIRKPESIILVIVHGRHGKSVIIGWVSLFLIGVGRVHGSILLKIIIDTKLFTGGMDMYHRPIVL